MAYLIKRIFSFFRPFPWPVLLLIGGILAELAFETFMPLSFKFIIDYAIVPQDGSRLTLLLILLVTGAVAASIIGVVRDRLYARIGTNIVRSLYEKQFERLQRLSADYFSKTGAGSILSRFNTDIIAIDTLIMLIPYGVLSFVGLLLNVILLFILQWKLALCAAIGLPLCLIGPKLFGKKASESNYTLKEEQAAVTATVQEQIGAQPVIRAFSLQEPMIVQFRNQMLRYGKISLSANFYSFLIDRTTNMGLIVLNLIAIGLGSVLAFQGHLSIGSLLAFNAILISITHLVQAVSWLAPQIIQASAGLRRIDELLEERPSVADPEPGQTIELAPFARAIEFSSVTFSYLPNSGKANLKNVNLTISKNQFVAFVGASGSGKSTIINLLMRFYDPSSGAVLFDGVDLRKVSQASLRRQMSIVFQESFLFNRSIRDNIRLGKLDATDAEIIAAAAAAEIDTYIRTLPEGYDTLVGERGGRLSGGQRQRIAIARAIIRNPQILILDEATSALDPATEDAINRTLLRLSRDRTVVSITHRLASVEHSDYVYVLEGGEVAEQGSHTELLMLEQGKYRASWEKQHGFSFSEDGFHADISADRLKQIPLLSNVEHKDLEDIAQAFVTESFGKGQLVMEEGEEGDKFYIIVRGEVEVLKNIEGVQEPVRVAELADGDFFGELALLRNSPRNATIRTLNPTVFITLKRRMFNHLLTRAPHLRERLADLRG